jgi:hypothetical protein
MLLGGPNIFIKYSVCLIFYLYWTPVQRKLRFGPHVQYHFVYDGIIHDGNFSAPMIQGASCTFYKV